MKQDKILPIFLLLFVVGMLLLGLFGYGYYSYSLSGRKIAPYNPIILPVALPLILPYVFLVLYNTFFKRDKDLQTDVRSDKEDYSDVLKNKEAMKISFEKSVVEIRELAPDENVDMEILKGVLFYPYNIVSNIFEKIKIDSNHNSVVTIKYMYNRRSFKKDIILPFSKINSEICLKMEKETILYVDKDNPSDAVLDLKFIEKYT